MIGLLAPGNLHTEGCLLDNIIFIFLFYVTVILFLLSQKISIPILMEGFDLDFPYPTGNSNLASYFPLKDPSQARLCYCFDLKFAIKLLVERDKTSTVQLVKI